MMVSTIFDAVRLNIVARVIPVDGSHRARYLNVLIT